MIGRIDEVVFDCADPPALAAFWAQVLGGEATGRDDDWWYVDPPGWTRVAFQRVPEGKAVKNRVHLDVEVADIAAATEQAEALGAARAGRPARRHRRLLPGAPRPRGQRVVRGQARVSTDPRVEDAFALLYAESYGRIVRYAARRGAGSPEDVAQGVFRLAWTAVQQGVPVTLGWLVGAADSLLPKVDLGLDRRVLRMRFWDGLSVTEIATVTGLSRTAVLRHLSAARRVAGEPNPVPEVEAPLSERGWDELRTLVPRAAASLEKAPPRRRRLSTPVRVGLAIVVARHRRHDRARAADGPADLDGVLDFPFYTSTAALEDASDTIVRGTLTDLSRRHRHDRRHGHGEGLVGHLLHLRRPRRRTDQRARRRRRVRVPARPRRPGEQRAGVLRGAGRQGGPDDDATPCRSRRAPWERSACSSCRRRGGGPASCA